MAATFVFAVAMTVFSWIYRTSQGTLIGNSEGQHLGKPNAIKQLFEQVGLSGGSYTEAPTGTTPVPEESQASPEPSQGLPTGIPGEILEEMRRCLSSQAAGINEPPSSILKGVTLRLEEALVVNEKEYGPITMQGDLWSDWVLRLPDGMGRKLHLENHEDESGRVQQHLSLFQVDQSGKAMRISVPDAAELNPTSEVIMNYLNEGEIERKETARYYQFTAGQRLEVLELDGVPSELEMVRGEVFFRCDTMRSADACTCVR